MLHLKTLRLSMALQAGSQPTEDDLHRFSYCRLTNRSSENLRSLAGLLEGRFELFREAIGINSRSSNVAVHPDEIQWRILCAWLKLYIPQFEKKVFKMAEELAIPDASEITEQFASALGIDTNFLQYYVANKTSIREFVEDIRGELGTMAELKLFTLIAQGDPATIRWYLPRANRELYHLTNSKRDEEDREVNVIFDG